MSIGVNPRTFLIKFEKDNQSIVIGTLAEFQHNIFSAYSEGKPVLMIPKGNKNIMVSLGDTVKVLDGEIVSVYREIWSKKEKNYARRKNL